jgi:hypothetical protein
MIYQINMLKELFIYYETVSHSNTTLANHLINTHNLLLNWGAKEYISKAGLYHTIYNTETLKLKDSVSLYFRNSIKSEIGRKAERLIFLYAKKERVWFNNIIQKIFQNQITQNDILLMPLIENLGYEKITRNEVSEICAIILANSIEQVSRQSLDFYDENYWDFLYTVSKKSLPNLNHSEPLLTFENIPFEKSILNLPSLLNWKSLVHSKEPICNFDKYCSLEFNKCIDIIDKEYTQVIPFRYLYNSINTLTKMNSALSPKILSKYLNREQFNKKENLKKIYDAFLLQYKLEAKHFDTIGSETFLSADDGYFVNFENDIIEKLPAYLSILKVDYKSSDYDVVWNFGNHTPNLSHYKENEIEILLSRLYNSLDFIKQNNSITFGLIIQIVKVISLRKDKSNLTSFGSSSWPHSPGLIGIINIDNFDISKEKIISSIIHETIHSYLYYIEIFYPFCSDVNRYYNLKAKSPWTGRVIPIASFIHACFVWYGIYHFWKEIILKDGYKFNSASEANKCAKGFASEEYILEIEKIKTYLRPDIYKVLCALKDTTTSIEEMNTIQVLLKE